jgi:acyl-coenzyme A thioesterase PaaI-like protein
LHAGVLFTLAESTSGEYLLKNFSTLKMDIIPVIRKAEIKYSKPGKGIVYSKAVITEPGIHDVESALEKKGRVMIKVKVDIYNDDSQRMLTALFEWFVAVNSSVN